MGTPNPAPITLATRFTGNRCRSAFTRLATKGRDIAGATRDNRPADATRNPLIATAAAAELLRLSLADALSLLLFYHDADRRRFERAVVRWHALLCLETRTLSPADAQLALAALNAPADGDPLPGASALRDLLVAHGQRDAAAALERWLDIGLR